MFEQLLKKRSNEVSNIIRKFDVDRKELVGLLKLYYNKLPSSKVLTPEKRFSRALSFAYYDLGVN